MAIADSKSFFSSKDKV